MGTPKGGYFNNAGVKLPSVTTVLGRFKDSGGLLFWAYKTGREHEGTVWRNRICKWADLLWRNVASAYVSAPMDKLVSEEKRAWIESGTWEPEREYSRLYDVSEAAAQAGTLAHDAIEAFIKLKGVPAETGEPYPWPDAEPGVLAKAQNAFDQFLEWYDQTKIQITDTEFGSHSEVYGFGGTLDAIGTDSKGRVVLLDWKTSNAIYPDYLIQLAAYALLLEENRGIKVEGFHIVRVAKENADFAHASFQDLEHEKGTFLTMLELYHKVKKIEQRVR